MSEEREIYTLTAHAGHGVMLNLPPDPGADARELSRHIARLGQDVARLTKERNAALRRNDELEELCGKLSAALNAMRQQQG